QVRFVPFPWTGLFGSCLNNAHRYRVRAGLRLREKLRSLVTDEDTKVVVFAHSHGGNVALYALADDELQGKVAWVVCMATPYFTVSPANASSVAYESWWMLLSVVFVAGGGFVAIPLAVVFALMGIVGLLLGRLPLDPESWLINLLGI